METNKNNVLIIGLITLLLGLVIGYFVGTSNPNGMMGYNTNAPTAMHGAVSGMMESLEGKTGEALDIAFLNGMIIHHQGAVEMATVLLQSTKRPELVKLGNDIITAQTQEIGMMKQWSKDWFNQ